MKIDEPESDGDGYLTDEYLDCVRGYEFSLPTAERYLLEVFPDACEHMSACSIDVSDGETVLKHPVKRIEFHTGGWSGAEELLDILLGKFWIASLHTKWKRGGHYWFEVPVREPLSADKQ